jgi:hypothetical protein
MRPAHNYPHVGMKPAMSSSGGEPDLAQAVASWVTARWHVRAERPKPDLATAVEHWLATRWGKAAPISTTIAYAEGRLAEAVAKSPGGRWRGLHRRPRRDRR